MRRPMATEIGVKCCCLSNAWTGRDRDGSARFPPRTRQCAIGLVAASWLTALIGCANQTPKATPPQTTHPDAADPSKITHAGPGQDFPAPESFYPIEAARLYQEGAVVIHLCVDATGKLLGPPTLEASSGNSDLDSAAVLLATAGNGHYRPATRNGANVQGCAAFRIRFKMAEDPRWPLLSRKLNVLNAQFAKQAEEVNRELESLPRPVDLDVTDQEQLATLRLFSAGAGTVLSRSSALTLDYIVQIDRLSAADDIPESERNAFLADWGPRKTLLRQYSDEFSSSVLSLIAAMDELITYVETAKPPIIRSSGTVTPTPRQRSHIEAIEARDGVTSAVRETAATRGSSSYGPSSTGQTLTRSSRLATRGERRAHAYTHQSHPRLPRRRHTGVRPLRMYVTWIALFGATDCPLALSPGLADKLWQDLPSRTANRTGHHLVEIGRIRVDLNGRGSRPNGDVGERSRRLHDRRGSDAEEHLALPRGFPCRQPLKLRETFTKPHHTRPNRLSASCATGWLSAAPADRQVRDL